MTMQRPQIPPTTAAVIVPEEEPEGGPRGVGVPVSGLEVVPGDWLLGGEFVNGTGGAGVDGEIANVWNGFSFCPAKNAIAVERISG